MQRAGAKLGWILALAQMGLTLGLLSWSHVLGRRAARVCDMPGPDPAWRLAGAMNSPLLVVRLVWLGLLSDFHLGSTADFLLDNIFFVIAVGLLWYGVALNLDGLRNRHSVVMFRWMPLRLGGDALLLAVGALLGYLAFASLAKLGPFPRGGVGCFGSMIWLWWVPNFVEGCLYAVWSFALVFAFSRDLLSTAGRNGRSHRHTIVR